jgi:hypothetical protein
MIQYLNGYKFKLYKDYTIQTTIIGINVSSTEFNLRSSGELTIYKNFAWNGATNWIDTNETIRATLVHDVLYQLIRDNYIPREQRILCDKLFYRILIEDKCNKIIAKLMYFAVKKFGYKFVRENRYKVYYAPTNIINT